VKTNRFMKFDLPEKQWERPTNKFSGREKDRAADLNVGRKTIFEVMKGRYGTEIIQNR